MVIKEKESTRDVEKAAAPSQAKSSIALKDAAARSQVVIAIAMYATCSSVMLVINKVAVHLLPVPSVRVRTQGPERARSSCTFVFGCPRRAFIE